MRIRINLIAAMLLLTSTVVYLQGSSASAVSGAEWQAGRITDDVVFTNKDSMTPQQIQEFLNSKLPTCDTNGQKMVYDSAHGDTVSRATYGARRGNSIPFTCITQYHENPDTKQNNYGNTSIPSGARSAAQLIWEAGQTYNISPKTLLITLQKEQSLVTDDWPFKRQYLYAMGAYCPDSGPGGSANCDPAYASFGIQMKEAARLYRYYLDNMSQPWWSYKKPGVNYILWNVSNTGCGGSNVNIVNKSTAALYTYTPYQPNQAALNNLYGTGDGCSAYGNRNYWRMFHDWFGTTYAPTYAWQFASQYAYTDSTKSTAADLTKLVLGQRVYIGFKAKNTGNLTWSNSGANPTRAGASSPQDRVSAFCDTTWISCSRTGNMIEASVAPGETATFEFWYKPSKVGTFNEYFKPLAEGVSWTNDAGMYFHSVVQPPIYSWNHADQYAFTTNAKTTPVDLTNLTPGQRVYVGFKARNTGNMNWTNSGPNPARVGTSSPIGRASAFCDPSWLGCNRPANMLEASVAPGTVGTFEFWYQAPPSTGSYKEYFLPVVEGITWMNDIGLHYNTLVKFDASGSGALNTNQTLTTGQYLTSPDRRYRIILQGDGNLVLYSVNRALWSSATAGLPITRAAMQGDGNLVLYDAQNKPYWHTSTAGKGPSGLVMQGDGNLVIYDGGNNPTWFTRTNGQL